MKKAFNQQKGMSFPLILLMIGLVAFVGLFAVKVGPAYFEYMTVSKIIDETSQNATVMSQPKSKVLAHINKSYRTNNLWDLRAAETIVVKKDGRSLVLDVDYEKRSQLFGNIHVVTVFKKTAGTP